MRMLAAYLLMLAVSSAASAAVFQTLCDRQTRKWGLCTAEQDGQVLTVFAYGMPGPLVEGGAQDVCASSLLAEHEDCQAARVRDALAADWSPRVECTQALASSGLCHPRMVGEDIPNPITKTGYADRALRFTLQEITRNHELRQMRERVRPLPLVVIDGEAR